MDAPRVELLWIPLGAGGAGLVRICGRVFEAIAARRARRRPLDLYHTALEVRVDGARFVIENAWPSPDARTGARGVVVEGPVWARRLARFRIFRYEVRCWRDGRIPDAAEAVARVVLTEDPESARRLLGLVVSVPPLVWGRDESRTGDMWNSNSVTSWLLKRSGLAPDGIEPPDGGRAPGWYAGITVASAIHV